MLSSTEEARGDCYSEFAVTTSDFIQYMKNIYINIFKKKL